MSFRLWPMPRPDAPSCWWSPSHQRTCYDRLLRSRRSLKYWFLSSFVPLMLILKYLSSAEVDWFRPVSLLHTKPTKITSPWWVRKPFGPVSKSSNLLKPPKQGLTNPLSTGRKYLIEIPMEPRIVLRRSRDGA